MAVPLIIRRWLKQAGLLGAAQSAKHAIVGPPNWQDFKPADPRSQIATLICFEWLRERALLSGTDYMEFGIFRGFNLWFTQAVARAHGVHDMRFVGFDSFFGLPEAEGGFAAGSFSAYRQEVEFYLNRYGVDWSRTILVEGFFDKTLTPLTAETHRLRPCSLCVVDCDLYVSTVPVLDFIADKLTPTALLYFDDWNDFGGKQLQGQPRAFAEFLERRAGQFSAEPLRDLRASGGKGQAFIMRRIRQSAASGAQDESPELVGLEPPTSS